MDCIEKEVDMLVLIQPSFKMQLSSFSVLSYYIQVLATKLQSTVTDCELVAPVIMCDTDYKHFVSV